MEKHQHLAAAAGKNMLLGLLQITEQCVDELRCGTIVRLQNGCVLREEERMKSLRASLFWCCCFVFFSCSIHSRVGPDLEQSSYRVRDALKLQQPLTRERKNKSNSDKTAWSTAVWATGRCPVIHGKTVATA